MGQEPYVGKQYTCQTLCAPQVVISSMAELDTQLIPLDSDVDGVVEGRRRRRVRSACARCKRKKIKVWRPGQYERRGICK